LFSIICSLANALDNLERLSLLLIRVLRVDQILFLFICVIG